MNRYAKMTQDDFDSILESLVIANVSTLTSIPGVYECVSEHFNNDILEEWERRNPIDEEQE